MVAFRRPQNLRDLFVHSDMKPPLKPGTYKCKTPKCMGCKHVKEGTHFQDSQGHKFRTIGHITCNSNHLTYLLTCNVCNLKYVGQTSNEFKVRIYQHIRDIRAKANTTIATHFRLARHSEYDVTACAISTAPLLLSERLLSERAWIHILKTTQPSGLNVQT